MKYTSIQRNMRGFHYQSDYNTIYAFWHHMRINVEKENNEIEWAKLFDAETGDQVAHYYRGCEIPE